MKIIFNESAKLALKEMIGGSTENYIRIKVFYGCGRPAFEIYPSFKGDDDVEFIENDIKFIMSKSEMRGLRKLEIKYDKEVYNKGFYIRDVE